MNPNHEMLSFVQRAAAHPSQGCTIATCLVSLSLYGYLPNKPLNLIFIVAFAISFIGHMFLAVRRRAWSFLVALGIGTLLEVVGYYGRVALHKDPFKRSSVAINIVGLTVAPAFLAAGIYLTLKHLVIILGTKYSRFSPQWYTRIFIICDIVSIIIQTGGATLSTKDALVVTANGLMEAGISFQVFTLLIFGGLALEFYLRYKKDTTRNSPVLDPKIKSSIIAVVLAYSLVLIRCIDRIAEMAGGWRNPIMQNQAAFVVLDGAVCLVACLALNIFHPGAIFQQSKIVLSSNVHSEIGSGSGSTCNTGIALEKKVVAEEVVSTHTLRSWCLEADSLDVYAS